MDVNPRRNYLQARLYALRDSAETVELKIPQPDQSLYRGGQARSINPNCNQSYLHPEFDAAL
jgi:hypothetical protein